MPARVPRPRRGGDPAHRGPGDRVAGRVVASHALAAVGMSLPWPLLLLEVSERSSDGWVLGAAAAARMLPYVLVSWCAGRIGDRVRRDRVVRLTLAARVVLLGLTGVALAGDHVLLAVVAATLAVAVATPAYPSLAAGMPGLAGRRSDRMTALLVTVEVASFVVGPAVGGLLLVPVLRPATVPMAVALVLLGWLAFAGVRVPSPVVVDVRAVLTVTREPLWRNVLAMRAIGVASLVNVVLGATGVALVGLSVEVWRSPDVGYGLATSALGFGALGGPLVGLAVVALVRPRWSRAGVALVLTGLPVALVAAAPDHLWALAPLAVVGAAATYVEAEAIADIQEAVPDGRRAGVLGISDSAIVTAMMLGAFAAPPVAAVVGHRWLLVLLGVLCCLGAGRWPEAPTPPVVVDVRDRVVGAAGAGDGQRRGRATRMATSSRTSTSSQAASSASLT